MKPVTARGIPGNKQGEQMNSKMIAVLAVAIMAVSGCVVTMSAQSDAAEAVDLGMVYVDENSAKAEIKFNETAYSIYESYDFLIAAQVAGYDPKDVYAKIGDSEVNQKTADLVVNTGEQKLNLAIDGSEGVYTVTIGNDGMNPASSGTYTIVFTLYVTAYPEANAGLPMTPIQYELDVNVRSFDDAEINIKSGKDDLYAGISGKVVLSCTTPNNINDYSWYATGLPEGWNIGIDDDGKLALFGMTAADDEEKPYNVNIVGRDSVGNEYRTTTPIILTFKATPEITYEFNDAVKEVAGSADTYMIENDKEAKLTITNGFDDNRTITVSVIDEDGDRATYIYSEGMDIPTDGVGKYVIEMTVGATVSGDSGEVTATTNGVTTVATLYVVPNVTGAGAGFIVVGQP